jgi:hypothetical protein
MAVQFHVAHSATVKGAAAVAGGPYYCAQGSLWAAYSNCTTPGAWTPLPPLAVLKTRTDLFAKAGNIDSPSNLAPAKVWLFSGTQDRTVVPAVVQALRDFYGVYKATPVFVGDKPAGHAIVTEDAGNPDCGATQPPYINDCDYDAAGELLKHLLGPLEGPLDARAAKESGRLQLFDQNPFVDGKAAAISMADSGYVYLPKACEAERCRVHVVFHGCRQNAAEVGERFAREAGYNRWADSNRIVVLYPQTLARSGWSFSGWNFVWNPRGCWDWWGYTGAQYATKNGPQIRAVKAMLDRLSAPRR